MHNARLDALQLAVWVNQYNAEGGEQRTFHTATLECNFKDKDDAGHQTRQLRESDLGEAQALRRNAQQFLIKTGEHQRALANPSSFGNGH